MKNEKGQFVPQGDVTQEDVMEMFRKYAPCGSVDECWEWRGATNGPGYGVLRLQRTAPRCGFFSVAHRVAYALYADQPIPRGMLVCHHCDNPRCVNPHHLFLGTDKDNSDDKIRKGRQSRGDARSKIMLEVAPKGETHYATSFTNDDIVDIRRMRAQGLTYVEIGAIYNVGNTCIYKIIKGKRWKHLNEEAA